MIRHPPHRALLAVVRLLFSVACARAAFAASVIPAAATNYIFTTPLRPAHIRGEVMGSPPAYYIPRSEDIDWINEAVRERLALRYNTFHFGQTDVLVPEFGKWSQAETNRFHQWVTAVDAAGVTNVVIGYNLVTNTPSSADSPGPYFQDRFGSVFWGRALSAADSFYNPTGDHWSYLDPDVTLVDGLRVLDDNPLHAYTNFYTVAGYSFRDPNTLTNAFSLIEMPMTNGTVSVHTNAWSAYKSVPSYDTVTSVVTLTYLDYCHMGDGQFPGYTNAPPLPSTPYYYFHSILSNAYVSLRGTSRLAEEPVVTYAGPDEIVYKDYYMGHAVGCSTNRNESSHRMHYLIRGYKELILQPISPGTNVYESVWVYGTEEEYTIPQTRYLTMRTRFKSSVVTTGAVQRVTLEAAFAVVRFYYAQYLTTGGGYTVDKTVLLRTRGSWWFDNTGEYSCVNLGLDARRILDDAVSVIPGVPAPPQNAASYSPPEGIEQIWGADLEDIILIYRIHPTSKFTDW